MEANLHEIVLTPDGEGSFSAKAMVIVSDETWGTSSGVWQTMALADVVSLLLAKTPEVGEKVLAGAFAGRNIAIPLVPAPEVVLDTAGETVAEAIAVSR